MKILRLTVIAALLFCCTPSFAQTPTPLHAYELNNSLTDTYAGPDIVNNGAALGASGLTFGANQGPTLSNWLGGSATAGNYSIEMYFSITQTASYRKLIDFKDLSQDAGWYNVNTSLIFYPNSPGPAGSIPPDVMTHLVVTRDGASNNVVGYINGSASQGFSFTDGTSLATYTGTNNIIQFLRDDFVSSQGEASPGFVDFIRIYDHAVTAEDALNLYNATAVPEPATIVITATGMGLILFGMRRHRRHRRRRTLKRRPQVNQNLKTV